MTSVATYGGQKECLFLNLMISMTVGSIMWRNDNGIADHIFRKCFILLECLLCYGGKKCKNDEKRFREPKMAARMKLLKVKNLCLWKGGSVFM